MRKGDFSGSSIPSNVWFGASSRSAIRARAAVRNNITPRPSAQPERSRALERYPLPTAGFLAATRLDWREPEPRDTRKDTCGSTTCSAPETRLPRAVVDISRGRRSSLPRPVRFARTKWDRPNTTSAFSWTNAVKSNLLNEFTFGYSLDEVIHQRLHRSWSACAQRYGINYPYIFR